MCAFAAAGLLLLACAQLPRLDQAEMEGIALAMPISLTRTYGPEAERLVHEIASEGALTIRLKISDPGSFQASPKSLRSKSNGQVRTFSDQVVRSSANVARTGFINAFDAPTFELFKALSRAAFAAITVEGAEPPFSKAKTHGQQILGTKNNFVQSYFISFTPGGRTHSHDKSVTTAKHAYLVLYSWKPA